VPCTGAQRLSQPRRDLLHVRLAPSKARRAEILAELLHPDIADFGHRGAGWRPLYAV